MPLTGFLFWNLNKRPLLGLVAEITRLHDVQVLILAECQQGHSEVSEQLSGAGVRGFRYAPGLCKRIQIHSAFPPMFIVPRFESATTTIRRVSLPAREEIVLAAVHLPSKLYWADKSQDFECAELARVIAVQEEAAGHARTVLVGDFNMNPFESGLAASVGLNAVMSAQVAARGTRTVQQRQYGYFYNPMWGYLGDRSDGPPGTHYYERAEHLTYYWNMFDQVLLRPALAPSLSADGVRILSGVGPTSLLDEKGRPDKKTASDHLPIIFHLEF